ncbi:MAG: protein translocase subunit SecD, partial [Actinomycetota bacterium]
MKRRLFASLIGIILVAALAIGFTVGAGDKPSLGLDLQGGASITLQPEGEYDALALDVAVEIIRSRVDAIGVAEPEIIRQGDTVVVNLPGVKDQQRALDIVGRTGDLQLRPVLQQGSVDPTAGTDSSGSQTPSTPTTIPVGTSVPSETTVPEEGGPGESRGARPMVDTTVPVTDTTVPVTDTTVAATDVEPIDATTGDASADATTTSALPDGSEVLLGRDGSAYLVGPVAATGLVFENNASAN